MLAVRHLGLLSEYACYVTSGITQYFNAEKQRYQNEPETRLYLLFIIKNCFTTIFSLNMSSACIQHFCQCFKNFAYTRAEMPFSQS